MSEGTRPLGWTQTVSSSRSEARLQQIDFPDEFAGCLVRELVGPRDAIEFGSFGPKPGETELAFDLVHSPRQRPFLPGLRTPVDTLAIEFHNPRASIHIKIGIAAAFSRVVLRLLDRLNCGFRRSDARPILLLLLQWLGRPLQALEEIQEAEARRGQTPHYRARRA